MCDPLTLLAALTLAKQLLAPPRPSIEAIYRSPADQLRSQADAIEAKERDRAQFAQLYEMCTWQRKP